jgi:hypothetical protein
MKMYLIATGGNTAGPRNSAGASGVPVCPPKSPAPSVAGILPALLTYGRAFRTAGIPAGALAVAFPGTPVSRPALLPLQLAAPFAPSACPERSGRASLSVLLNHARASRTAGILAGSFAFSRVITHHSSLVTGFLIYGSAIGNPRKALKT